MYIMSSWTTTRKTEPKLQQKDERIVPPAVACTMQYCEGQGGARAA